MRKFKRWGFAIAAGFLFLLVMFHFLQEKLIFWPSHLPADYEYSFAEPFEEFFLEASDGARLNALHFKVANSKGLILYFHGNAGDLSRWGKITSFLVKKQYDVIVMDYRTYGKSTGSLNEESLYSDAQLFYDHAKAEYPENQITIYGRSLGAAIATNLASKNQPKRLILETPFYNLNEIAKGRFPFLPVKTLLNYAFESNNRIKGVSAPITIIHGTEDKVVPYASGKRLYESAPNQNKTLITIEGGEHNNLVEFDAFHTAIDSVLQTNKSEER